MADIAIISMLYESIGVMSVYDTMYLYQFVYLPSKPFLKFLQSFAFQTSIIMKIEWLFTSVSLVIETRYQNMAVVAVWRTEKMGNDIFLWQFLMQCPWHYGQVHTW